MFIDKNDKNRLINFDLEKGQVSEDFHFKKQLGENGIEGIVNEYKNAQNTESRVFHGMNRRNMFTIDPRIST
jgi:hypothetical protein